MGTLCFSRSRYKGCNSVRILNARTRLYATTHIYRPWVHVNNGFLNVLWVQTACKHHAGVTCNLRRMIPIRLHTYATSCTFEQYMFRPLEVFPVEIEVVFIPVNRHSPYRYRNLQQRKIICIGLQPIGREYISHLIPLRDSGPQHNSHFRNPSRQTFNQRSGMLGAYLPGRIREYKPECIRTSIDGRLNSYVSL
jgi:hypothetical protein